MTSRTDAKGQQTQYSYDAYGRLSEVRHYIGGSEDTNQRWDYTYDSNTVDSTFSASNLYGRLATVQFGARDGSEPGYLYEYSYSQAGRVTNQRMQVSNVPDISLSGDKFSATNLDATYTWDNEGRWTAVQYPTQTGTPAQFAYQYDAMGRASGLTETYCSSMDSNGNCIYSSTPRLQSAAYNAAGQMTSLIWANSNPWQTETFTYNNLLELTQDNVAGYPNTQMNLTYSYNTGHDNGRITALSDSVLNQTVNYTYDALNRLTAASASGSWGQAYTYDGFGNLTSKTVTAGTGSSWSNASDPSSNRLIGQSYDANGNAQFNGTSYDVENRLTARIMTQSPQYEGYQYDPSGKRVSKLMWDGSNVSSEQWVIYFYDITGRQAAVIAPASCGYYYNYHFCPTASLDTYFAGRQVQAQGRWVLTDRLGSVRAVSGSNLTGSVSYLPYGEERNNPTTADGDTKFATYLRDRTVDNQDYAEQRYYNPWMGRFNSADPISRKAAKRRNPTTWNSYAYSADDPLNNSDPTGTTCVPKNGLWSDDGTGCGYVGQAVSPNGTFNFSSTGASGVTTTMTFYCAPGLTGGDCSDQAIYGPSGLGQQIVHLVGQQLNSISAGGFTFAPVEEAGLGPLEGSVLVISTEDSNTGHETSMLGEIGAGDIAVGYEQGLTSNSSDVLAMAGLLPGNGTGIDLGFVGSGDSGMFGFYFGIGDYGFGGYISLGGGGGTGGWDGSREDDDY